MSSEEISVVLATYNGERYIREQLNSIINQTLKPKEIILVDDNSSDDTVKIADDVLSKSGIDYYIAVHEMNQGVGTTFQDGVKLSNCIYIMLCDQDDVWDSKKIEISISEMQRNQDAVMVVANAMITDAYLKESGKNMFEAISFPGVFNDGISVFDKIEAQRLLLKRNYVTGMCLITKREILFSAIPFSKNMTHDAWIAWCATSYGSIIFLEQALVKYRQHDGNVIGINKKSESLKVYLSKRKEEKKKLYRKYSDFKLLVNKKLVHEYEDYMKYLKWRYFLSSETRAEALGQIIKNRKLYKKYAVNDIKEIIKDILEVLFV